MSGGGAVEIRRLTLPAHIYQQFDADVSRDVPAEAYGGWKTVDLEIDPAHTAVVVMHAWDTGAPGQYPGWQRAVEYMPRAQNILETVFPTLLHAIRASRFPLFHVVGGGEYYQNFSGYRRAVELAGEDEKLQQAESDPTLANLRALKTRRVFVGEQNEADVARGFKKLSFALQAVPVGEEGIAENAGQLFALCADAGINHLIYAGFAINWCLLMSPGGMLDMSRRGVMCSAFRQAVTAVENKESARDEVHKESALWRVALAFGFVFDVDPFIDALQSDR